jgi:hypothetical protein
MTIPTKNYNHSTPAAALFFRNKEYFNNTIHQAIRVEVPELGKEFSDGEYIGKDPEGTFYYDAASDIRGKVKAKVYKVTGNNQNYVHIKFYTSKESETYAEFVAEDDGTVDAADMVKYTENGRDGKWSDLDAGSANATVYKRTSESKITLTAGSVSKEATLTLEFPLYTESAMSDDTEGPTVDKNFPVNAKGTLHFKKLSDLDSIKAKYASYNNDRIVFYEDDVNSRTFVAYFIPLEESALGIASEKTVIFSDVTWDNLS